jgi:hypothetical protein
METTFSGAGPHTLAFRLHDFYWIILHITFARMVQFLTQDIDEFSGLGCDCIFDLTESTQVRYLSAVEGVCDLAGKCRRIIPETRDLRCGDPCIAALITGHTTGGSF